MGKDQELLEAARNGNFPVVEKILFQKAKRSGPLASLRRGPGANVQDSSGYSSLHHAALNGHKEIVEILLSNEASTNIVDVKGSSPLHLAAWSGNVDIVRMLLCHGPSIPNVNLLTKDNETALHCAAQYGHTEVVCLLLEHSCDPTIRNTRQETALDLAAQYGRLETVDMLVRTHPELIQPYNGRSSFTIFPHTPLHLASRNGHKSVVEVLLSGGMNVNVKTAAGTALHEAALCGKTEVVRTLLERGIDLSLKDSQNNTVTDILKQFPCHVVHDIYSIIKRHSYASVDGKDDSSISFSMTSIHSPQDNAIISGTTGSISPSSASPMHYDLYERRNSGSCSVSLSSDGMYSRSNYNVALGAFPKSYTESNFLSDDLSYSRSRDFDSVSVCSTTSSNCSRDRRSPYPNNPNAQLSSPGSISNKISPTPPKKPPRRNLSISPTHISPQSISIAADQNGYDSFEYAFFRQNQKVNDADEFQTTNGNCKNRDALLRRGKSAEHYLDTKFRHSVMIDPNERQCNSPMIRGKSEDLQLLDSKFQPIAITSVCGNIPYRTTNPRRKLRRQNNELNGENYDPSFIISRGDLPFKKVECEKSPITVERILIASGDYRCHSVSVLRSSRENLLDEQKNTLKKPLSACPLSPTHYQQPPTPDHPPPSAVQAENRIHDRIRPLSQEYSNLKRKSRDIETETEEELLLLVFPSSSFDVNASNGSICSSISLSDKSVSTDNNTVEEFIGDVPFAGLFKGSINSATEYEMSPLQKLERPKTLRQLKSIYNPKIESDQQQQQTANLAETQSKNNYSDQINGSKNLSILSPFDEQEEWAKISEIMASFGSSLVRESVFVAELEQEFQNRLGLSKKNGELKTTITQWLTVSGFSEFEEAFVNFGYDNIDFINGVINDCDLKELGMINECDRDLLLQEAAKLPSKVGEFWQMTKENGSSSSNGLEKKFEFGDGNDLLKCWLDSLGLSCYADTFQKHMYTSLEKIRKLWEVELTAVLEITKPGHRRRILASIAIAKSQNSTPNKPQAVNHMDDLNADLNQLKSNLQQLKNEIRTKIPACNSNDLTNVTTTSTTTTTTASSKSNHKNSVVGDDKHKINGDANNNATTTATGSGGTLHRHNHKKSRPAPPPPVAQNSVPTTELEIRNPSELLIGVPSTLTTKWRHKPNVLLNGTVNYVASYLGSTVVKELRGTESTKKSIQKLKKSTSVVDCRLTPEIILAISYCGVKFLNVDNQSLICEHEIRNIHCACQDAEDLTHFAYITKDHASKTHYCHVFCVQTMDQATEVILTLGEAFEVAYQMALKEHFVIGNSNVKPSVAGHTRSHSVNNILDNSSAANPSLAATHCGAAHSRSHSINNIIDSPPLPTGHHHLSSTANLSRSSSDNRKSYSSNIANEQNNNKVDPITAADNGTDANNVPTTSTGVACTVAAPKTVSDNV